MIKLSAALLSLALLTNQAAAAAESTVVHAPWTRDAVIYEVNLRQYTPQGTIKAFAANLPRLKKMGVDIIWLMPIHPIGERNRKGTLGSYYASKDYLAVAPEYGTMDDLRAMVKQAHALGMHVILDWVGNHTAWDNPWTTQHPDWYKKNDKGEIYPVTFTNEAGGIEEWTDVVGLDYNNKALWQGMTDAMAYWIREADIDGFRCDAAGLVPTEFWNQARATLDQIKPMFMLAEWNEPTLHEHAFDMSYDWDLSHVMKEIGKGKAGVDELRNVLTHPPKAYPREAYRMQFTNWSNGQTHAFGGEYLELVPDQRIVHTDRFDDPNLPGEMRTTITFTPVPVGTEIAVVQEGIPAVIPTAACYLGWQESLQLLALLVEPEIPG